MSMVQTIYQADEYLNSMHVAPIILIEKHDIYAGLEIITMTF